MDVRIENGGHLGLLDRADSALWMQDEDRDILLAAQTVDGSRSSISTRSSDNSKMMPILAGLALVPPHQEVLEQVAKQLQGDILECERGAVEQFQQIQVLLLVQCDERGGFWGAEGGVAAIDDLFEVGRWDFGGRDV